MRAPTMCAWRAMRADTRMQKERTLPPPVMPAGLAHSPRLREPATAVYVRTVEQAGTRLCGMRAPTMCAWRAMRADTRMQKERTLPPPVMPAGLAHSPRLREPATAVYVRTVEQAGTRMCGVQSLQLPALPAGLEIGRAHV